MKEAVGSIPLFQIVIVFVLLFTGYVSLSINHSKAYNIKNELINIIKNQGGVCTSNNAAEGSNCENFSEQIRDYFKGQSYRGTGDCSKLETAEDNVLWVGFNREGEEIGANAKNAAFCVRGIKARSGSELPNALYYQVKVFYQLDLPILGSAFQFSVGGETSRIYSPNECDEDSASTFTWCER